MRIDPYTALVVIEAICWLLMLAYVASLDRRCHRAEDRIAELEREVEALWRDETDADWWKRGRSES